MKRMISIILALCLILSLACTGYAQKASSQEGTTEQAKQDKESKSSQPAVSESSENESNADNPIGDNSSYYNIKDFKEPPTISAESAILIDAASGAVIYSKEADAKRYPASITKVMTALLTIENCSMDDIVTFSDSAVNGIEAGSSSAGINVGAKLTVEDTLYAMMLVSANEAAAALAEHVGGSIDEFAKMMTERAEELGCTKTNFTNPHGLPDENHYTSAHDMSLIVKQAMKYDEFRKIAGTITYTLEKSDTLPETLELWNHAKILRESSEHYYQYAEGAKTGFTQAALNTLVSYAKKGDVELICVVLKDYGAENSYKDSTSLYKWGFKKVKALRSLENYDLDSALASCPDINQTTLKSIQSLDYTFNKDYYTLVKSSFDEETVSEQFIFDEDKNTGLLGYIQITSKDQVIGKCPVTYDITTDNAVRYLNGDPPLKNTSSSNSGTAQKTRSVLDKICQAISPNLTKRGLVVCAMSILIILIIIVIVIRNIVKKIKRKKIAKQGRRASHREQQKEAPQQKTNQNDSSESKETGSKEDPPVQRKRRHKG